MKRITNLFAYILTYAFCWFMALIGLLMAFVSYLAESGVMCTVFVLMFGWFVYAQVVLYSNMETESRKTK